MPAKAVSISPFPLLFYRFCLLLCHRGIFVIGELAATPMDV